MFSDIVAHADHLARLPLADLVLDTRHHGGGATTIDALWMGVPLLTCAGDTPASNQGALFAGALGIPEMAVRSLDAFEERAVQLATDRVASRALRAEVEAKRRTAPLFDQPRFTRHFEAAIAAMWEQAQSGRRATIDVAATA